ncbi:unnamed protein product [Auanema sp. JU1783]|nr:unnamed protein product [Auanema sp. JU1783]
MKFEEAINLYKELRAQFDQRQILKREFELFIRFEEETYSLWGLYQQAVVGNINVPKMDYQDPREMSWMWGWIHGNRKWHAWNQKRGMSKEEAADTFVKEVVSLKERLPKLLKRWKDEQDPSIPEADLEKD